MDGFQLKTVLQAERDLIRSTLQFHNGNRTRSARTLGITSNTLRSKMLQFGLSDDFRSFGGRPKTSGTEPVFAAPANAGASDVNTACPIAAGFQLESAPAEAISAHSPSPFDPLAGPMEHALFLQMVEARIGTAKPPRQFAMLAIDFNRNDALDSDLGIEIADETHIINAMLLAGAVDPADHVFRTAAAKFCVLVETPGGAAEARSRAEQIWDRIQFPLGCDANAMCDQLAMGFSLFPSDAEQATDLVNAAQLALRESFAFNDHPIVRFEPRMREKAKGRIAIRSGLRRTLAAGKIVPFYQPKIDLHRGRIVGVEAFLRHLCPIDGIKLPSHFKAAFKDRSLSKQLSDRILDGVTEDVSDWISRDIRFGHVSLNASVAEFSHVHYGDMLIEAVALRHLDPESVKIEIPERALADTGKALDTIRTLRARGFKIALDDFGIGFATLAHLHELEISEVKLDRSLVAKLETDTSARRIIASTIEMATELDITVVAKGVETLGQAVLLKGMRCAVAQGHFFGKPMRARSLPAFIQAFPRKIRQVLDFNDAYAWEDFVR
ncbi:MAG: EAL domain-containing protein [Xanthobacteraceae bacterium]|nr:EAL domain-containing protein [Xanthobacteraceae bacterium]